MEKASDYSEVDRAAKKLLDFVNRNQMWETVHGEAIYCARKKIEDRLTPNALYTIKTAEG